MQVEIRQERFADAAAIRDVNARAFGQDQEANLVEALRSNGGISLSLVAILSERVVGHILYSPLTVAEITGAALAPLAVLPEYQRRGIGRKLVEAGNRILEDAVCPFVIVLGYPDYYRRFGFMPAGAHGITSPWDVPDEVFMILISDPAKMRGVRGLAQYREEFSTVT